MMQNLSEKSSSAVAIRPLIAIWLHSKRLNRACRAGQERKISYRQAACRFYVPKSTLSDAVERHAEGRPGRAWASLVDIPRTSGIAREGDEECNGYPVRDGDGSAKGSQCESWSAYGSALRCALSKNGRYLIFGICNLIENLISTFRYFERNLKQVLLEAMTRCRTTSLNNS